MSLPAAPGRRARAPGSNQILVAEDVLLRQTRDEPFEEPPEKDHLSLVAIFYAGEPLSEEGVMALGAERVPFTHRVVYAVPGGERRQGVAHDGITGKAFSDQRQERRQGAYILHDQMISFTEPFTVHRDLGPLFPGELSPDASLPDTSLVGIGRNRPGALLGEDDAAFVDRPA